MQMRPEGIRNCRWRRDGDRLRLRRAGREHVCIRFERTPECGQDAWILCMDDQGQAQRRDNRRQTKQSPIVRWRLKVWVFGTKRLQNLLSAEAERIAEVRLEADRP